MLLNKVSVIADQICTYARSLGLNLSYHEPTMVTVGIMQLSSR